MTSYHRWVLRCMTLCFWVLVSLTVIAVASQAGITLQDAFHLIK